MSRDMKPRGKRAGTQRKKSGGGTLIGLFIGLVIGVVGAAAVVWYIQKTPLPFNTKAPVPAAPTSPARENGSAGTQPAAPLPLAGKPGDPIPAEKPRFDFYKILPGNGDGVPEGKPATTPKEQKPTETAKDKAEKEPLLKDPVYLQAGSFQNAGDADNQKAKLALMGVEASVQQVMLQDKVWYRVRLGPFKKMDDVNTIRADLAKQGVEAAVVKKD